jgi:processive 1,2-diacylglycerol beta-glucosyltransferase
MALKTLLILTAGFGEGHNAAARNLRDALLAISPQTRVVLSDVFLDGGGFLTRIAPPAYLAIINHAPALWQAFYGLIDHTRLVEWHIGIHRSAARRLESLLSEYQPSLVVSTYPGNNHLLDFVCRRRVHRPFHTFTIITDSLTINSVWYRPHSDLFLVANDPTAAVLRQAGVPPQKIRVSGFPVPRVSGSHQVDRPIPPRDGRWRVLYLVNSGHRAAPDIVSRLLDCSNTHLTVAVGRDERLGHRLKDLANGRSLEVLGWIPDRLPTLMAESHLLVTKAGGATVQEALAAETPMIITQVIPGQEEGNARLVVDYGAGILALSPAAIAKAVEEAFCDQGSQWKAWHAACKTLGHPKASEDIARLLLDFPKSR